MKPYTKETTMSIIATDDKQELQEQLIGTIERNLLSLINTDELQEQIKAEIWNNQFIAEFNLSDDEKIELGREISNELLSCKGRVELEVNWK